MRAFAIAIVAAFCAAFLSVGGTPAALAADKFITIGTAGVMGVYYPAGGAICRLVNRGRKEHGIRCSVESTGGSIYNLGAIRQGELDLGVAQSDWQYHAFHGTSVFAGQGEMEELRALFSLHSEPLTIVARKDAKIKELKDLKGKRVDISIPGSGARATFEQLMEKMGWTQKDFALVSSLKAAEQGHALCEDKIDAFIYMLGHPNGMIQEVTGTCETTLVPVVGKEVEALMGEFPFYSYATIPGGMYNGSASDVKSFGVKATFVTSTKLDPEIAYQVVKAVFDNFDNFKTLHPVFATLEPAGMAMEGNTAPLHDGAVRYYKEHGLLRDIP